MTTESSSASEGKKTTENTYKKNYSDRSSGQTATKESSAPKTKMKPEKNTPGKGSEGTSKKTAEKEYKTSQPKYQKEMRPEKDSKSSEPSSSKSPPTTQTSTREEETFSSKKSNKRKIKKLKKNKGKGSEDEEVTQKRKGGSSGDARGNNAQRGRTDEEVKKDPKAMKVKDSLILKKQKAGEPEGKYKRKEGDNVTKGLRDVYYMTVPPVYPPFDYTAETTFASGDQVREFEPRNLAESVSLSELYVPQKLKPDTKCKQITYQPNKMDNFIEEKCKEQPFDFSVSDIYQNYIYSNSPFTQEFKHTNNLTDHCNEDHDFGSLNLGLKTINSRKLNTVSHTETTVSTESSMGLKFRNTRGSLEHVSERIMEIIHQSHPNLKPISKDSYKLKHENLGYQLEIDCEGDTNMNRGKGRTNMNDIGKLAKNEPNKTPMSILIKHLGSTDESKIDTSEASSSKLLSSSHLSSYNDVRNESMKRITVGLRKAVNNGLTNSYDKCFTGIQLNTSSCASRGRLPFD